jgi:uncharacterized protein
MKNVTILALLALPLAILAQTKPNITQVTSKPFVLGKSDIMHSTVLNEDRTLNIYLPEGYNQANDTTKYHVIYLLDGSADEDFIHVAGLVQYYSFPWINQLPPTIVVGIANTDRRRDFAFPTTIEKDKARFPTTGGSANFIAYIEQEVQPYIKQNYQGTGTKTIIGQSLGGLLATEILLTKPALFDNYIIISPSLWWNDGSLLKQTSPLLDSTYSRPTQVYIGVGKEGLAPCDVPHVMEVDANLLAEKITSTASKKVKTYFDYLPAEDHATISHQAIMNAIKLIF